MSEQVLTVDDVTVNVLFSLPARLQITARGTVGTPNWTNPQLAQREYVAPPADGIYEFDFIATPPAGNVNQIVMPISAVGGMTMPDDLKGIRVIAARNSKEALLEQSAAAKTVCVKGTLTDEGVECQALRSVDGALYTIVGDLSGFKLGDEVVVCGTIAEISFCMQGITINASWIGKEVPKAL